MVGPTYADKTLRQMAGRALLSFLLLLLTEVPLCAQSNPDAEQLGKALEYFTAGKYHESLLIFQRLDRQYALNDRFKAYIGLCHYYEWDYKQAASCLDEVADRLDNFSPHERSVYYYAAAESHFQLADYEKALPYYLKDAQLCYDNEKGDVYYRIGLCHAFAKRWQEAVDAYTLAERYLSLYRPADDTKARRAQIRHMLQGCRRELLEGLLRQCGDLEGLLRQRPDQPSSKKTLPFVQILQR